MTRRLDQLQERGHGDLLSAVEHGDSSAMDVLREIQRRYGPGKPPETCLIQYSPHHGWCLRDLLDDTPPVMEQRQ